MSANPIGIVRWTLSAFHANPDLGDGELIEILEEAGLPHAARAVMMLPLAYGRRILDGLVTVTPTYVDGDRELVLADDPIFAAADRLARSEASRADLDRVGLRSSEVDAVNQALHHGSKPEDLVLSPPRMRITEREVPVHPDAQETLDELVRAHHSTLSLEARVFPGRISKGRVQLQLDVVAKVGDRELIESFGGFATTIHGALGDTIKKFTGGTLHVLLATLDRRELGGDQVEWEPWGDFDACLGSVLRMWSPGGPPHLSEYLDALKRELLASNLSPDIHWVRTYLATDGKEQLGLDMLVDNDGWPPGQKLAREWPWPVADAYYAIRHFFMLIPSKRETN
ncbi:MAG: DUF6348 family protein [Kofleriaceae bacterium]